MIQLLQSEQDAKKLLNFSVKIAKSMLSYGAEVYRVEDTVNRIYKSFDNIKAPNKMCIRDSFSGTPFNTTLR